MLAERALARRERLYDMLSATDQCVMRAPDSEKLLSEVCRVAVSHGGFRFAWVGLVRTELGEPLGAVLADPGQIGQVLMNLVVNARDAMPTGGTLTITTADVELTAADIPSGTDVQPGPFVRLGVSDTGSGMDAAPRQRLLEPFFTTKAPGKGTGLGLSTAFRIVSQSGGVIRVFSDDLVLRHGVDEATMDCLPKPFKLAELTGRVAALLAG